MKVKNCPIFIKKKLITTHFEYIKKYLNIYNFWIKYYLEFFYKSNIFSIFHNYKIIKFFKLKKTILKKIFHSDLIWKKKNKTKFNIWLVPYNFYKKMEKKIYINMFNYFFKKKDFFEKYMSCLYFLRPINLDVKKILSLVFLRKKKIYIFYSFLKKKKIYI